MATHIQQVRRINTEVAAPPQERVIEQESRTEAVEESPGILASRIIWFVAGVILVLLAFRFVFILAGANQGSGFVDFIYSVSHPFAAPFFGIFGYHLNYGVSRVELSTLVAMVVYALIAYGLERLLTIRRPRSTY
jgi:uncharacterized protein YggT (Ycf19 family)